MGKLEDVHCMEYAAGLNQLVGSTALYTPVFPGSVNCLNVPLRPLNPFCIGLTVYLKRSSQTPTVYS